jgi:hypothetical protein
MKITIEESISLRTMTSIDTPGRIQPTYHT